MTCTNSTNDTIIIDEISSGFGAFGALVCLILGTGANLWALLTMITRPKARNQPLSPLVFYLSISYFFFCIFCLPLVLMRFIYRENIVDHLGKVIEFQLRLGLGIISKVLYSDISNNAQASKTCIQINVEALIRECRWDFSNIYYIKQYLWQVSQKLIKHGGSNM